MLLNAKSPSMRLDWPAFGGWIAKQQTRQRPGISDRELARRVGLSPTHIGYLKKGRSGTTMSNVEAIAIALGSTQQEAVEVLIPPRFSDVDDETALIARRLGKIVSRAPKDQREQIIDALEDVAASMVKIAAA